MSTTAAASSGPGSYVSNPALLTWLLALINFTQVVDNTICNVSLPAITGDLGAAPSQGAWVITSYTVSQAITVPLTGWIAGRFGQVRVMTAAVIMFGLMSLLSSFAWSMPSLIVFRILQGCAGGLMVPLSQALMLSHNPPERRGSALALWSTTTVVGPVMGPILGGWITDNFGWTWIFLINVPISLLVALSVWRMLRQHESKVAKLPLDWVGLVLLVVWVGCLQVMLDTANEEGWFDSGFIVTMAAISLFGFCVFIAWELTTTHPVVDLSIFRNRNFLIAVVAMSLAICNHRGPLIILPLWLQTQVGYTAQWAGFVMAPAGLMALLLAPFVGRSLRYIEPRIFSTLSFGLFGVSYFWRTQFTGDADYWDYALPQFIQGFGVAMFFVPLITMSMGNMPREKLAAAAGLQNFVRIVMGSFGISAYINLWGQRQATHRTQLSEHISATSPQTQDYMQRLADAGYSPGQILTHLDQLLTRQSYTMATNDIYWVAVCIAGCLIALIWNAKPPFNLGGPRAR